MSQDAPTITPRDRSGKGPTPTTRGRLPLLRWPDFDSPRLVARASLVLIVVGVVVRLAQYFSGRSLWLDEAFLWLNLTHRSAGDLLGPLDLAQGAPALFLMAEKLSITVLGDGALALRLVPLAAGLAALPLTYLVARRCLRPAAVPVAVGLVALSTPATYFAAETKQYSSDLAVAAALLLLALWLADGPLGTRRALVGAASGAIALWASDPAALVLAGVGASLLVAAWRDGDRRRLWALAAVTGAWLASFGVLYVTHVSDVSAVRDLTNTGSSGPLSRLSEVPRGVVGLLDEPVGIPTALTGFAAVLAVLGAIAMIRERRALQLALIASPIAALVAALALGQYPLGTRFGMFLVPGLVILVAAGLVALAQAVRPWSPLAAALVVVTILAVPAVRSAAYVASPQTLQEQEEVVAYVARHREAGDSVYLYYAAQYAFAYYGPREGIAAPYLAPAAVLPREAYWDGVYVPVVRDTPSLVVGRFHEDLTARIDDVDRLRGRGRVWLVFSHSRTPSFDEPTAMLERASRFGRVLDEVTAPGARAVLMEFP